MFPFVAMFRDIAEAETRTITTLDGRFGLPPDRYVFVELYCIEPRCDCRRVMLQVHAERARHLVATINHAFETPTDFPEPQTFLDPLNPQSNHADAAMDLFLRVVLDEVYRDRLERHYRIVKDAVDDPSHRIHERLPRGPRAEPIRRAKVGRNEPCFCGSGRKAKRCCGEARTTGSVE